MSHSLTVLSHFLASRSAAEHSFGLRSAVAAASARADTAEAELAHLKDAIADHLGGTIITANNVASRLEGLTDKLAQKRSDLEAVSAMRRDLAKALGTDDAEDAESLINRAGELAEQAEALDTIRALLRARTRSNATFAAYLRKHSCDPDRLRSYLGVPSSGGSAPDDEA